MSMILDPSALLQALRGLGATGEGDVLKWTSGKPVWGAGGGGVSDHGALTGLADDDHGQYQLRSEKGAASGYASLGAGGLVPVAQLASGVPDGTKFVRDDGTLQTPAGGGQVTRILWPVHANPAAGVVLTNQPAALQFLLNVNRSISVAMAAGITQVRLTARKLVLGATNSFIRVSYSAVFSSVVADFLPLGSGSVNVQVSLAGAVGIGDSGWIDIAPLAAIDRVTLACLQGDGDAVADPQVAYITLFGR